MILFKSISSMFSVYYRQLSSDLPTMPSASPRPGTWLTKLDLMLQLEGPQFIATVQQVETQ